MWKRILKIFTRYFHPLNNAYDVEGNYEDEENKRLLQTGSGQPFQEEKSGKKCLQQKPSYMVERELKKSIDVICSPGDNCRIKRTKRIYQNLSTLEARSS